MVADTIQVAANKVQGRRVLEGKVIPLGSIEGTGGVAVAEQVVILHLYLRNQRLLAELERAQAGDDHQFKGVRIVDLEPHLHCKA